VGTHPGFGRVIAIRWFEMLVGVLMKQVAIAIVLSVLLYCYSLIMGTADAVLPWALKILMIALVTVAVFIYRKPFSHLFSAVGYGTLGSTERAEYSLREASPHLPPVHPGRRDRGRPRDGELPGLPVGAPEPGAGGRGGRLGVGRRGGWGVGRGWRPVPAAGRGAAAEAAGSAADPAAAGTGDAYTSRLRPDAPPPADGDAEASDGSRRVVGGASGPGSARTRNVTEADSGSGRVAPAARPAGRGTGANGAGGPNGSGGSASAPATGWSRGAGRSAGTVPAGTGPRPRCGVGSAGALAGPPVGPRVGPRVGRAPPVRSHSRGGGAAPPVSRPAPRPSGSGSRGSSSGGSSSGGSNGGGSNRGGSNRGGSNGGGSNGGGPAWPASGWPSAGPRQRSAGRARPNPAPKPPAEPADSGGGSRSSGQDEPPATPFWLRPIRRDK